MEASTRIELVYTDLQSAASPLRQLAILWCGMAIATAKSAGKGKLLSQSHDQVEDYKWNNCNHRRNKDYDTRESRLKAPP